jgi:hypothetical protein
VLATSVPPETNRASETLGAKLAAVPAGIALPAPAAASSAVSELGEPLPLDRTEPSEDSWEAAAPVAPSLQPVTQEILAQVPAEFISLLDNWFRTQPTRVRSLDSLKLIK